MNEMKKCIRCKRKKTNNGYNFKITKSKMGLADSIDIVCKKCRGITPNQKQNAKRKKRRENLVVCKNRNCEHMVDKIGFKLYCSDACRLDENNRLLRERLFDEKGMNKIVREIPQKFLVRGAISGVHY